MYILIKSSSLVGIFSTKEIMKEVIEVLIKDNFEKYGTHGDYHFKYIEMKVDEPWVGNVYNREVGNALFSLSTLHSEYFPNKIETDWSTGEIIKL